MYPKQQLSSFFNANGEHIHHELNKTNTRLQPLDQSVTSFAASKFAGGPISTNQPFAVPANFDSVRQTNSVSPYQLMLNEMQNFKKSSSILGGGIAGDITQFGTNTADGQKTGTHRNQNSSYFEPNLQSE